MRSVTARDFTPGGEGEAEFFEVPLKRARTIASVLSCKCAVNPLMGVWPAVLADDGIEAHGLSRG